ncbi:MAG TPA: tetratricopeptide repeat protein [Pyrinomonadaceae bacterium]
MPSRFISRAIIYLLLVVSFTLHSAPYVCAQDEEEIETDASADPIKLFERGQDAHAQGEGGDKEKLRLALDFYEQALKLRPEFPEAEYQKGVVLVALGRQAEGEAALKRAAELRPEWSLPSATLASLLVKAGRDTEAEPLLKSVLQLESRNPSVLALLAELHMRRGNAAEALKLWRRLTLNEAATAAQWAARGMAERATGDRSAALVSFEKALGLESGQPAALLGRAEARIEADDKQGALADLREVEAAARTDARIAVEAARLYARAGASADALRLLDALDAESQRLPEVAALREKIKTLGSGDDTTREGRAALEELLKQEPTNAPLLARLGALYRTDDPQRSMDYFRRAAEIDPKNADYATGYAAALVQARQFDRAAQILRQVVAFAPQNYAARSNLATALDHLKLYREALAEYKWISQARPDLAITYFFIARMHDQLGEYPQALSFYETFLSKADAQTNRLEIDKVNLRLPSLRNQIKQGEGVKNKRKGER